MNDCPDLAHGATLLLASIRPCNVNRADSAGFCYYKTLGALQVVDVMYIEGLVGRVRTMPGGVEWAIVEREGLFRRLRLVDDEAMNEEAATALDLEK